jgi:hypothetical protein
MKNFAVIENNIVTNVIFADTQEIAQEVTGLTCIELTDGQIVNLKDNYINGVFSKPVVVTPTQP